MYKIVTSSEHNEEVGKYLSSVDINWHFNTLSTSHFGGVQEDGVKSMKMCLKISFGDSSDLHSKIIELFYLKLKSI